MSPAFDPRELGDELDPNDHLNLQRVALRLEAERPVPAPAFRGDLRRSLVGGARPSPRPARLRAQIAGYALSGLLLLAAGASSAAGFGPLAA